MGSAKTRGSRKGLDSFAEVTSHDLHRRLREHADSIRQAVNLELDDFRCRYLIVDEIWIPFSESMLVSWFAPLWNRKLDSFGSHDPGKGRYKQQRSLWDVVHPGRRWAEKLQPNPRPLEDILAEIGEFLDGHGSKHD